MATADVSHHCTIAVGAETYGFTLDERDPWRELDINEFAPQVAGGAKGYGDLSLYTVIAQEDWRHGFGFVYQSDEAGYAYTGDGVDTRFSGLVQLASTRTLTDASGHPVYCYEDFGGAVYAGHQGGGIRKRTDDTTWADVTDSSPVLANTDGIFDLLNTGDYLVAARDGATVQLVKSTDGVVNNWSLAGSVVGGHEPFDFRHLAMGGGRVWGSEDLKNFVHYSSATDLSDMEGQGTTDTNVVTVGAGTVPIQGMTWFQNNLHVGRADGLFLVGDDDVARMIKSFHNQQNPVNFDGMCVGPDDRLYFPIRDKVYRWTGRNLEDITPGHWGKFRVGGPRSPFEPFHTGPQPPAPPPSYASGETPPYKVYILFHDMFTDGTYIYVIGRTNDTLYHEDLLCWTGSGWHKLYELVTDGVEEVYRCAYSPVAARVFISKSVTSGTTTTYMVERNAGSPIPYDSYPTSGNHYLYSSKMHLGLLEVPKCFDRLDVRSFGCTTGDIDIDVAYQLDDDGSWRTLGSVTVSPYEQLDFPTTNNTGYIIQFRYDLQTDTAGTTPYLDSTAFRLIARPTTYYGLVLRIKVGAEITRKDGVKERRMTAAALRTALHACRDSITPVTVKLPLGIEVTGYVTSYDLGAVEYGQDPEPSAIGTIQIASI